MASVAGIEIFLLAHIDGDVLLHPKHGFYIFADKGLESLARALAQQPLLLLLDEPTLHLDIGAQVDLLEGLRRLAAENRYTVVVVTHELNLVGEYADQVVLMQRGRCLRVGSPAAVYQRELLEQVFQAQLSVELGANGRPRVSVLSQAT